MDTLWRKYFQKVSPWSINIPHQGFSCQPGSGAVSPPISGESGENFVFTVSCEQPKSPPLLIVSFSPNRAQT